MTALYERLKATRAQLKAVGGESPDLQSQIHLLQMQCGKALDDLQAEYAAMKVTDSTGDSEK